jgi:methionine-rich copper-binding protein CopC
MKLSVLRFASLVAGCILFFPEALSAHAWLKRAEPAIDGRTAVPPTKLRLWFSEAPEVAFSRLTLTDSAGTPVKLGAVERGDTKLEIRANIAAPMRRGRYVVNWSTAGPDGHPTSGAFSFTVNSRAAR